METSVNCEGAEDLEKENSVLSVIYFLLTSFVFSLTVHQLLLPVLPLPFPFRPPLSRFSPIRNQLNQGS